jgi:hypothetical protein
MPPEVRFVSPEVEKALVAIRESLEVRNLTAVAPQPIANRGVSEDAGVAKPVEEPSISPRRVVAVDASALSRQQRDPTATLRDFREAVTSGEGPSPSGGQTGKAAWLLRGEADVVASFGIPTSIRVAGNGVEEWTYRIVTADSSVPHSVSFDLPASLLNDLAHILRDRHQTVTRPADCSERLAVLLVRGSRP